MSLLLLLPLPLPQPCSTLRGTWCCVPAAPYCCPCCGAQSAPFGSHYTAIASPPPTPAAPPLHTHHTALSPLHPSVLGASSTVQLQCDPRSSPCTHCTLAVPSLHPLHPSLHLLHPFAVLRVPHCSPLPPPLHVPLYSLHPLLPTAPHCTILLSPWDPERVPKQSLRPYLSGQ